MNWPDERYVRLYTRNTVDWQMLSFEAQGLLCCLLRVVDRAGVLDLGKHGKRGVAVAVGHPSRWAILEPALEELLVDGCLVFSGSRLFFPHFIEAQEAQQSDAQRQRDSREKRRALAAQEAAEQAAVTKRDSRSQNVTESHIQSQAVTRGHSSLAVPSRAVPNQKEEDPAPVEFERKAERPPVTSAEGAAVLEVFEHYRATFEAVPLHPSVTQRELIEDRFREGFSTDGLKRAITGFSRSEWHTRKGQISLEGALKSAERVQNCWRWLEHPPDAEPTRGRATAADVDWTKPRVVEVDAEGQVLL